MQDPGVKMFLQSNSVSLWSAMKLGQQNGVRKTGGSEEEKPFWECFVGTAGPAAPTQNGIVPSSLPKFCSSGTCRAAARTRDKSCSQYPGCWRSDPLCL